MSLLQRMFRAPWTSWSLQDSLWVTFNAASGEICSTKQGLVLFCTALAPQGGAEGVPIVVMNANSWSFYFNEINAKGGSKWER